ncbi:MAG: sigma-70 family RNA polymerase sigma factor [Bacteroidales bacterium]|nr:sigma-70 family RNA polymerase sigma factor [Bacteroidales bacterium]
MGIRKITDLASGMESELALLVKRHNDTICALCRSFFPDDTYLRDALYCEIMCNLWNGIRVFRNKGLEKAWVYRVAVNTAINSDKKENQLPETTPLTQEMEEVLEDSGSDPLMAELYTLTEQLEIKEKTLIDMYLDRVPQAEIARELSLSETNVSTMIGRIKLKLKKLNNREQE